jgi:hypothetical protein
MGMPRAALPAPMTLSILALTAARRRELLDRIRA